MPRPVKFPELSGLSVHVHAFYTQRALEGVFPTELALQVIRNEEARHGAGEQRRVACLRAKAAARKPVAAVKVKVVYAETAREPVAPRRISREEALARKAW